MSSTSLRALFQPTTVAVIGASRSRTSVGGEIFANLVRRPFAGAVYPVNASAAHVQGVRAYKSMSDVPESVDLAIVATPASGVPHILRECVDARVKAAVVVTAGFGESGLEGAQAQEAMVTAARSAGMRIVGPNCLGVLNTDPEVALHATFATGLAAAAATCPWHRSPARSESRCSTKRAITASGSGTSSAWATRADVSAEDLLEYWERDAGTQVVLLYLESFANPGGSSRSLDA